MNKEQLKNMLKNKNNRIYYIILIVGVVLLMFSDSFVSDKKTQVQISPDEQISTVYTDTTKELENILGCVYGINKVKVMITYESSEEKTLAYDISSDISRRNEQDSEIVETKEDKEALLSSGQPYVVKKTYPKVRGVIVVAGGADNSVIKQNIIDSVKAVLDVADHKICVLNYKK